MSEPHCDRCETLPRIASDISKLLLWPPLGHTRAKLKAAAAKRSTVEEITNGMWVNVTPQGLSGLLDGIHDALTLGEQSDTLCLVHGGDGLPTVEDFGDAMSLRKLIALSRADWLLDVISSDALGTHFQPIVKADAPHRPFAHECLLRWRNSEGRWLAPQALFETAREAQLLFQLDRRAREVNIRNAVAKGVASKVFVNFMPTAIYDPRNCLRTTLDVINEVGLSPEDIVFEIVETEKIEDSAHLKSIMDYYKDNGFGVAMDDLGTGHATLKLLGALLPDYVKLDMELVRDVHKDRFKGELVRRVIELAHQFDIQVIAEGVEVQPEAAWLQSQGVDYLQGYFFARPGPEPVTTVDRRR